MRMIYVNAVTVPGDHPFTIYVDGMQVQRSVSSKYCWQSFTNEKSVKLIDSINR